MAIGAWEGTKFNGFAWEGTKSTAGAWEGTKVSGEDSVSWTGSLRYREFSPTNRLYGTTDANGFFAALISGFEVPGTWFANGNSAFVRGFRFAYLAAGTNMALHFNSTDSGDGSSSGPDLITALESSLIVRVTRGTAVVEFDFADDPTPDDTEPYTNTWTGQTHTDTLAFLAPGGIDIVQDFYETTLTLINPS